MKLKIALLVVCLHPLLALGQSACGVEPTDRPAPPPGCKDLIAECYCNQDGTDCHWTWKCVPDDERATIAKNYDMKLINGMTRHKWDNPEIAFQSNWSSRNARTTVNTLNGVFKLLSH